MFYLFSSDSEPRFKRNVLEVLCYPESHIMRFRYHANIVAPEIRTLYEKGELDDSLKKSKGKGLTVYAETAGLPPEKTFDFYPLREVEIIRVQVIGNVYYVDMRLGRFVDYFSAGQREARGQLQKLQTSLKTIPYYPLLLLETNNLTGKRRGLTWSADGELEQYKGTPEFSNQGYFFHHVPDSDGRGTLTRSIRSILNTLNQQIQNILKYPPSQSGNFRTWESVAEILSSAPSMQSAVFYLVEGFYRVRRRFRWFGEYNEYFIKPKDNKWDTRYPLKMGSSVVLKLLFFRSSKGPNISHRSLEIKTDGDAFAGFSHKEITLESRYNEERVLIACKRVFDSIFAPIIIELKPVPTSDRGAVDPFSFLESTQVATPWGLLEFKPKGTTSEEPNSTQEDIMAPHSFLLTQITAPRGLIFATLVLLALASFFLFMSPDYIQSIGWSKLIQTSNKAVGDMLVRNAAAFTQVSKVVGFVFTLAAGFLGFRKLPLGK